MRFASAAAAVDAQIAQARALLPSADCGAEVLDSDHERETWQRHARQMWESPGAIVRAGWLPAHVPAVLNELRRLAGSACIELAGRAAAATGLLRIDADVPTQAGVIERLRQSTSVGNVVIVRGRPELKALVDVWGPQGDRERLFASLKQAMDPHGILNAGRGPL
jgi:FAD/FMN-containing dehydrogenase